MTPLLSLYELNVQLMRQSAINKQAEHYLSKEKKKKKVRYLEMYAV